MPNHVKPQGDIKITLTLAVFLRRRKKLNCLTTVIKVINAFVVPSVALHVSQNAAASLEAF